MINKDLFYAIDSIKYPLITDKSTLLTKNNKYTFIVDSKATKLQIKLAIEFLFDVKTIKINTCHLATKKRRIGQYKGMCSHYKKAIVTLNKDYTINIFSDI